MTRCNKQVCGFMRLGNGEVLPLIHIAGETVEDSVLFAYVEKEDVIITINTGYQYASIEDGPERDQYRDTLLSLFEMNKELQIVYWTPSIGSHNVCCIIGYTTKGTPITLAFVNTTSVRQADVGKVNKPVQKTLTRKDVGDEKYFAAKTLWYRIMERWSKSAEEAWQELSNME